MDLQQLFEEILPGNRLPTQQVTSVTCDSRQVRRGSVFVCIAGSLTKVLQMLRGFCKGRLLTVFGCPGRRDRTKRPLMLKAVCQGADLVVMTADNPREEPLEQIFEDALAGFCNDKHRMRVIPDRREAILWALQNCRGGDILLLAGKGHEDYQVLADRTVYFDERQIVQEGYAVLQSAQREGKNGGRILQKKDFI